MGMPLFFIDMVQNQDVYRLMNFTVRVPLAVLTVAM